MPDVKHLEVLLLDGKSLEFSCGAKTLAGDIFSEICTYLQLKEQSYFGLTFNDYKGNEHWMQLEKKIWEHDLPKKITRVFLYFKVRFYIERIQFLMELQAINLFYLQLKSNLLHGLIETDSEILFELCAYILQESGDFVSIEESRNTLKRLQLISTSLLKKHPSISYCEDRVIYFHSQLLGHTYGTSMINFISIIESLPTYGMHFYDIKDKGGLAWWLGVGPKGIAIFDRSDKMIPRKAFEWRLLENLSFRERKFVVEIREQKKSNSFSGKLNVKPVSRYSIVTHAWSLDSNTLARSLWIMAVSQHQFYLDRKHLRFTKRTVWNLECLAKQLDITNAYSKLNANISNIIKSDNHNSEIASNNTSLEEMYNSNSTPNLSLLSARKNQMTIKDYDSVKSTKIIECEKLKMRKSFLEDELSLRINLLKEICLQEAKLTGVMPPEYPVGVGEETPKIRQKKGTSFEISSKFLNQNSIADKDDELLQLEMLFEIQNGRTAAILKLAEDKLTDKTIRKKHRSLYIKEHNRLKIVEEKLNKMRLSEGRSLVSVEHKSIEDDFEEVPDTPLRSSTVLRHSFRSKLKRSAETYSGTKSQMEMSAVGGESSSDSQSINSAQSLHSISSSNHGQVSYRVLPKKNKHELEASLRSTIGSRQHRRHSSNGKKLSYTMDSPVNSLYSQNRPVSTTTNNSSPCQPSSLDNSVYQVKSLSTDFPISYESPQRLSVDNDYTQASSRHTLEDDRLSYDHPPHRHVNEDSRFEWSGGKRGMQQYDNAENVLSVAEEDANTGERDTDAVSETSSYNSADLKEKNFKKKPKDVYAKVRRICRARTACEFNSYADNAYQEKEHMLKGCGLTNADLFEPTFPHLNGGDCFQNHRLAEADFEEGPGLSQRYIEGVATMPRVKPVLDARRASEGLIEDLTHLSIQDGSSFMANITPSRFASNRDSVVYNLSSRMVTNKLLSCDSDSSLLAGSEMGSNVSDGSLVHAKFVNAHLTEIISRSTNSIASSVSSISDGRSLDGSSHTNNHIVAEAASVNCDDYSNHNASFAGRNSAEQCSSNKNKNASLNSSREACVSSQIVNDVYARFRPKLLDRQTVVLPQSASSSIHSANASELRDSRCSNGQQGDASYTLNNGLYPPNTGLNQNFKNNDSNDAVSSTDLIFMRTDRHHYDEGFDKRRVTPAPAFSGQYPIADNNHVHSIHSNQNNYLSNRCASPYNHPSNVSNNSHREIHSKTDLDFNDDFTEPLNDGLMDSSFHNKYNRVGSFPRSSDFSPTGTVFPVDNSDLIFKGLNV